MTKEFLKKKKIPINNKRKKIISLKNVLQGEAGVLLGAANKPWKCYYAK